MLLLVTIMVIVFALVLLLVTSCLKMSTLDSMT